MTVIRADVIYDARPIEQCN